MSAEARKRARVMVVDDDEVVLEVTREFLESAGYEVLTRQSSIGTSAEVSRKKPDIVLLDVNVPGLAGDSLARLLANGSRGGPAVVLYSSGSRRRLLALARDCGAVGAVEKTSSRDAFLTQFEEALATRRGDV